MSTTMKCPFCKLLGDRVTASSLSVKTNVIARRRECLNCHKRYNTKEKILDRAGRGKDKRKRRKNESI